MSLLINRSLQLFVLLHILISTAHSQTHSIDKMEQLSVNGTRQTILIRGSDVRKPVLLLIHGGPGFSESALFRSYNRDLEKHFVVVNWDQRGTNLSYSDSIPASSMTIDQIVADAHFVIGYLKKQLKKEKVFVLGHSFGTIIGLWVARKHPEDLFAYIGMGQVIHGEQNERISFDYTLKKAKEFQNRKAIEELEEYEANYPVRDSNMLSSLMIQRKWLDTFGGVFNPRMNYQKLFDGVDSREMDLTDSAKSRKGNVLSMNTLWIQMLDLDFFSSAPSLDIPVYFIEGRSDYNTPFELVEKYITQLNAPSKKIIWFDKSAHFPAFEEPTKFNTTIVSIAEEVL